MKKIILAAGIVCASSAFILSGCVKKKTDTTPKWTYDNSDAPLNNATAENAFSEMPNMSNQAMSGNMVYYKMDIVHVLNAQENPTGVPDKANCAVTITIDTVGTTDTLIIDWGNTNCMCNDGKNRRGKLMTTWTGSYYNQGTVITHTPIGYYVNDNKVEGTMSVENMGNNGSGQPYYNININGTVTMANSGAVVTYTSTRVRTFTNGYTTQLNFMDDEYDITGTATGTNQNGDGWTTTVTSAIHVKVGCPFITKGVIDITPTNKPTRTIDYGSGACDASFTITINGYSYTVNF